MYFKFRGIDSRDMGVTVLTRPNIVSPETRTWTTFIDGKDGAYSHPMGLKPNSFSFTIAVEEVENIDKVLGWLNGKGRFIRSDLPNRYLNVHINEGVRLHRTVEWLYQGEVTVQVIDPFWYSIKDEWQKYNPNLIPDGWDSFEPYGSGLNYVENWDFTDSDVSQWFDYYSKNEIKDNILRMTYKSEEGGGTKYVAVNTEIPSGNSIILRMKYRTNCEHRARVWAGVKPLPEDFLEDDGEWHVYEFETETIADKQRFRFYNIHAGVDNKWLEIDWIQITPVDNQHLVVEKTPFDNGLTRIQTWGGKDVTKLTHLLQYPIGTTTNTSMFIENKAEEFIIFRWVGGQSTQTVKRDSKKFYSFSQTSKELGNNLLIKTLKKSDNLDFIASDPYIIEGNEPILANEGNYPSKPIIKLVKGEGKSVTIKTKEGFLTYTFPNRETEVEIDTTTKTATYNGETRDRFVDTDAVEVEFPPGPIDIQVEGGTAYFKKKDRWI